MVWEKTVSAKLCVFMSLCLFPLLDTCKRMNISLWGEGIISERNSELNHSVRPCSVVKYSKVYEKVLAIKSWLPNHAFLQIEYFSSKHRNWPLCFSHTIGKFYEMLLVVTALATRTRAGVHVGIAFLATCALPLFYIHIPESCRWLVSNSRVNKAQEIVVVRLLVVINSSWWWWYFKRLDMLFTQTPERQTNQFLDKASDHSSASVLKYSIHSRVSVWTDY